MNNLIAEIDKILEQREPIDRHTFFQFRHFLLENEPTIQAKMQCCLRELKSRRTSLDNINLEVEDLKDRNVLLEIDIDKTLTENNVDKFGIDLGGKELEIFKLEKDIELKQMSRKKFANDKQIKELQKKFNAIAEECQFFIEAFKQLNQTEELKPWDDLEVQKEYWNEKLGRDFRIMLLLRKPLDLELIKAVLNLHDDSSTKKQVLQLLESIKEPVEPVIQVCKEDSTLQLPKRLE